MQPAPRQSTSQISARTHLIQSEDRWEGKPLLLEPWQRRLLGEALAYDAEGWPSWRSVVLVCPRKNGKTGRPWPHSVSTASLPRVGVRRSCSPHPRTRWPVACSTRRAGSYVAAKSSHHCCGFETTPGSFLVPLWYRSLFDLESPFGGYRWLSLGSQRSTGAVAS
jgi:hypothetical protein